MRTYTELAIPSLDEFRFGVTPHPVTLNNGLAIGAGTVYPELNFTLPGIAISAESMPEVCKQYTQMITEACKRAVELHAPGLIVEFELLPELTKNPEWGAEVTKILHDELIRTEEKHGLKTGLRVTPNDIREFEQPPLLRRGKYVDAMFRSFELCAQAGADLLAIESTGGKEIHDNAILNGELDVSAFALGILGSRDMAWLWDRIVEISEDHHVIPAGDTACGFGNTAMQLAEGKFIPRVWAAVIRVMTVPRTLVAYERGALGPSKDCAYEGPYIKAIAGIPIALEGAEAACAHLSSIGNIAKAVPDLWSNESVNNIKLLGAMAPTVSLEQLVYATRLMNVASGQGPHAANTLRDWWATSDASLDPQAYVLRPDIVLQLSEAIIAEPTPYLRTRRAALETIAVLNAALESGELPLSRTEQRWLRKLGRQADELPVDESVFTEKMLEKIDHEKIHLSEYEL